MVDFIMQGRSILFDSSRSRAEQIAELRQAVTECYCGLGPACELWRKMTPAQRADCTRDKRASGQLLWRHGVSH